MSTQEVLNSLGIEPALIFIGSLSGIVSAYVEEKKGFFNYSFRAFIGSVTTTFTTPMLIDYFNLSDNSTYGIGFFVGLISMNIAGAFLKLSADLEFVKKIIQK